MNAAGAVDVHDPGVLELDNGVRPMVVFLPGTSGDNERLAAFRTHLGSRTHFIVPSYADWASIIRSGSTFDTLLADVLEQVTGQIGDRPAVLIGYSMGGMVAHEVARRLVEIGYRVPLIGVLDTDVTFGPSSPAESVLQRRSFLNSFATDAREHGPLTAVGRRAAYRLALAVNRSPGLRRLGARLRPWLPLTRGFAASFDGLLNPWIREEVARAWTVSTSTVPTMVYRRRHQALPTIPHDLGWSTYTTVLGVEEVGGTHFSLCAGRHGERLAERLHEALSAFA